MRHVAFIAIQCMAPGGKFYHSPLGGNNWVTELAFVFIWSYARYSLRRFLQRNCKFMLLNGLNKNEFLVDFALKMSSTYCFFLMSTVYFKKLRVVNVKFYWITWISKWVLNFIVSDECFLFIEFPLRLFLLITNPSTSRVTKTFSHFSCDDSEEECKGSLIM